MKCSFCGNENEEGASFCRTCAKSLKEYDTDEVGDEITKILDDDTFILTDSSNNVESIKEEKMDSVESENKIEEETIEPVKVQPIKEEKEKKNGNKPLIISIIIAFVVLVILVSTAVILVINPSPERVFKSSVDKMFNGLEGSVLKEREKPAGFDIEITPMISDAILQSNELSNMINSFTIKLSGWIDYKNKKTDYNVIANYKDKQIVGLEMLYSDKLYVISKDIFDKPLVGECTECDGVFETYNSKEMSVILSSIKNAIKGSLKKEYFEKKKENITINGKTYKALVSTLKLNNKVAKEIENTVLDKLLKDEKFIEAYAKISNTDKSTAKEEINKVKESLKIESYDEEEMNISIYTTGITNDFLKAEIKDESTSKSVEKAEINNEYIVSVNSYGSEVSFRIKFEMKENVKATEPDVSNAIELSNITSDEASAALENVMNSEGFKLFNNDFKTFTGYTIQDFLESMSANSQDTLSYN